MRQKFTLQIKQTFLPLMLGLFSVQAFAVPLTIDILDLGLAGDRTFDTDHAPLFTGIAPEPNVVILMDDSTSMSSNMMMPMLENGSIDGLSDLGVLAGARDEAQGRGRASALNGDLYYDALFPLDPQVAATRTDLIDNHGETPDFGVVAPTWEWVLAWRDAGTAQRAHLCASCPQFNDVDVSADLHWQMRSSKINALYYDPDKTYTPWSGVDDSGDAYVDAVATAAMLDPYLSAGSTIDLTARHDVNAQVQFDNGDVRTVTLDDQTATAGLATNFQEYIPHYYSIALDGTATRVDISDAAELQNFANWFQYYRSRDHIAKGVVAALISQLGGGRVGFATVSNNQDSGESITVLNDDVSSGAMHTLLTKVFSVHPLAEGSPLRNALWHVGEYFSCSNDKYFDTYYASGGSPTSNVGNNMFNENSCPALPAASGGECQAYYSLLVTDGFDSANASDYTHTGYPQNDGFASGADVVLYNAPFEGVATNADGDSSSTYDGGAFADTYSDTLADVAMSFYEEDINGAIAGDQRVVVNIISLGAENSLSTPSDPTVAYEWTNPLQPYNSSLPEDATNFFHIHSIDDLAHAAFNGRGSYISGLNTNVVQQMAATLSAVTDSDVTGGNISTNGAVLGDDSLIFTTSYNIGEVSGDLMPKVINIDGTLGGNYWASSAAEQLTSDTGRVILSFNPARPNANGTGGMAFTHANVSQVNLLGSLSLPGGLDVILAPINALLAVVDGLAGVVVGGLTDIELLDVLGISVGLSSDEVDYIRGVRAGEQQNGGGQRDRGDTILGPIFHSEPVLVAAPSFDYPDGFEGSNYSEFRTTNANRTPVLYIGANDGMLHGFNANTGEEVLAYVPSRLFQKLKDFDDPGFTALPFVDGRITVIDAYDAFPACGGNGAECWRTVLVGGLGGGAQAIYALDVTDPSSFSEANADEIVLWEFTDQKPLLNQEDIKALLKGLLCSKSINITIPVPPLPDITLPFGLCTIPLVEVLMDPIIDIVVDSLPDAIQGHPGMGYSFGQPNAGKMADGSWAAIFGNGVNSNEFDTGLPNLSDNLLAYAPLSINETGDAFVFVVDLATGLLKNEFTTGIGQFLDLGEIRLSDLNVGFLVSDVTNTLSTVLGLATGTFANGIVAPASIDGNSDYIIDDIYSVDLLGNLSRIDVSDASSANWDYTHSDPFLFSATNVTGKWQPVTTEPMVIHHPTYDPFDADEEGYLVLFGTGLYLDAASSDIRDTQSFYAIWDVDGVEQIGADNTRDSLFQRFIDTEIQRTIDTNGDGSGEVTTFRTITDDNFDADGDGDADGGIDWSSQKGWFIDLAVGASATAIDSADNLGERVIVDPIMRNGRIVFSSLLPGDNNCLPNDSSIAYQLDASDGSPSFQSPFDLNGDGFLNSDDMTEIDGELRMVSGRASNSGQNALPVVLVQDGQELHISITQDGSVELTRSSATGYENSRSTWREIR